MFFYHPRMMTYNFGPQHPLKPERLRRTMALLNHIAPQVELIDPGLATDVDLLRVHSKEYIDVVKRLSSGEFVSEDAMESSGFWSGDNPPFSGMFDAALAYCGGSVRAAEEVRNGADLAINIGGGLHHARRAQASGFCIFNDCAIACSILRETFDRVAYVDIDLHHGDGVQWIFYDDPHVMTCSIHESGRFLYPGTGFTNEFGAENTSINVPLHPMTTGDTWLWAFENGIMPKLCEFNPGAIVLQMGSDPHDLDPLGHLRLTSQEWLVAVKQVQSLGKPIVGLGGGGYEMTTVPRMWVAAILTLMGIDFENDIPPGLPTEWKLNKFFDDHYPEPRLSGQAEAESAIEELSRL